MWMKLQYEEKGVKVFVYRHVSRPLSLFDSIDNKNDITKRLSSDLYSKIKDQNLSALTICCL